MNSVFLNTLTNQPTDYSPVWLMRQAGRYLPEYRKVRAQAGSFLSLCKNTDLATEVTLQPLRRFSLDASIMFSDILVVPEAMGMDLYFSEGEGPKFSQAIETSLDIDALKEVDPSRDLAYVMQIIKNLKQELPANIPLIGFSGSPWTLACYMVEGGASKNYEKIKGLVYANPQLLHNLLDKVAIVVADYLVEQIKSGVDTIMIFDSWGGVLSDKCFNEFSYAYLDKVLRRIELLSARKVPSIVFTKGGGLWLSQLNKLPCNALGIDWTCNLGYARKQTNKILQGNLDPVMLSVATPEVIRSEVIRIIEDYKSANNGNLSGHIFNLGHGILPSAKVENVSCLIDTIHEFTYR